MQHTSDAIHSSALIWRFLILSALWILSIPLGCIFGPLEISAGAVMKSLAQFAGILPASPDDSTLVLVVGRIRLARTCIALLCGGALGVAGVALQGVLRNPLADPFTLGISAGAACGASLAIAFGTCFSLLNGVAQETVTTGAAFCGAILALALALILGRGRGEFGRETVILAGIAVAAFMGALVALIKALNEESVTSIVFWIMGSLQGRGWGEMPLLCCTCLPGMAAVAFCWRRLDVLSLGDEAAAGLGVSLGSSRLWLLGGASCMTAGCVAVCGIIGFVGLVVPHVLRLVLGPAHGPLLAGSFFCGGLFLLLADCIARSILTGGQELPVGVVTALVGGPFFAMLVCKRA